MHAYFFFSSRDLCYILFQQLKKKQFTVRPEHSKIHQQHANAVNE